MVNLSERSLNFDHSSSIATIMRGIYLMLFAFLSFETFVQSDPKPNVIICAEDLGIDDFSVYGASLRMRSSPDKSLSNTGFRRVKDVEG